MSDEKKWLASDGKTELRLGMPVLVRDFDTDKWWPGHYGFYIEGEKWPYKMFGGRYFAQCIPLAGNESLVGTDAPIPEPRQDAMQPDNPLEWGERVHVWHDDLDFKRIAIFCKLDSGAVPYGVLVRGGDTVSYWRYCERA